MAGESLQHALQAAHQVLILRDESGQTGKQQVARIRLRVAPGGRPRQPFAGSAQIVQEHVAGRPRRLLHHRPDLLRHDHKKPSQVRFQLNDLSSIFVCRQIVNNKS